MPTTFGRKLCSNVLYIVMYMFIIIILVGFIFCVSVFIHCELFDNSLPKADEFALTNDDSSEPIDVVYTWVNSKDPEWIELKQKALETITDIGHIDNTKARWVNTNDPYEEISLSIESVRTYLPWVRNIFVVTQRPQQLPEHITSKFNVLYVHHDQIIHSHFLPVFSSHAIEANIHRIPDLSEKFIYFNDDMYINRPMKISDFFYGAKRPIFRYYKYYSFYLNYISRLVNSNEQHMNSMIHCRHLFEQKTKPYLLPCIHQATPITKEIMSDAEEMFKKDWERTSSNKFRSLGDIVPVYISIALAYHNKKAIMLKNDPIKHTLLSSYIHAPFFHNNSHLICVNHVKASSMNLLRKQILSSK